jgi:hypothetical protein
VSPYVRTVKTASRATAVQIVYSSRHGSRDIEHIGSAHDEAGLEVLKAAARQRLAADQDELDVGLERTEHARRGAGRGPLPIMSSRMGHLWDALSHVYDKLGFGHTCGRMRCSASWCWPGSSTPPGRWRTSRATTSRATCSSASRVPDVLVEGGLTENGWVRVDPLTLAPPFPGIYPLGDCAETGTPKAVVFVESAAWPSPTRSLPVSGAAGHAVRRQRPVLRRNGRRRSGPS